MTPFHITPSLRDLAVIAWCILRDSVPAVIVLGLAMLAIGVFIEWAAFYIVGAP